MDEARRTRHHGCVTHGRLPRRAVLHVASFLVVLLAPLLVAAELGDRAPPIVVSVDGRTVLVEHGTTFGGAIGTLALRPEAGRLLDVEGEVIDPRADPGAITLDGAEVRRSTVLAPDDAIVVVNGEDRTEGTRREIRRLPGRQPNNPMYTLATSRMAKVTTLGRVSGKVVSVRYRPMGGSRRPPAVALTFDDGPWPGTTRRVVDILERMHATATFFMIGYLAERYPQIVRRVERAGMAIGTHSWAHPYRTPFDELTSHRVQTEIERPRTLLARTLGVRPTAFRPPGGHDSGPVVQLAERAGMRVVEWSVDPRDYEADATAAGVAAAVLRSVRPGSIVLLHDGGGDRSATIRALPRIVRGIRRMGLELVAIPA
jgi:peptidoglycan/xylan/chitin deacetylase (PgdA/CDA1 family)